MTTKRPSKRASSAAKTTTAKTTKAKTTKAAKPPRRRRAASGARRARKALVSAPPEKCFWVYHGPVLKDLRELREALERQISDAQFAHHVGQDRNDFANWVDHVLEEKDCARALRRAHSVSDARRAVEAALRGR